MVPPGLCGLNFVNRLKQAAVVGPFGPVEYGGLAGLEAAPRARRRIYGMKYALSVMRPQVSGAIVNMASVAGHKGFAITAAHNASKQAVIGLTKAAAVANARHNIRVNSISPLAVDTPQLRESFDFQGVTYEQAAPGFVTPRIMTVDEIARAVLFLASDDATSLTGMDLDVTGGQLA